MFQQKKSGNLINPNIQVQQHIKHSPHAQNKNNTIQSGPRFILKNPSQLLNRPCNSILNSMEDMSVQHCDSYVGLYQKQRESEENIYRQRQSSQHSRNNDDHINQSNISMHFQLQQMLQKQQMNDRKPQKSKTQNCNKTNTSFEITNNIKSNTISNQSFHVFNAKPKSVDIVETEQLQNKSSKSLISQQNNIKKDPFTIPQKNSHSSNRIKNQNELVQMTFQNETDSENHEELLYLRQENKNLVSNKYYFELQQGSIKKLNLELQQLKQQCSILQNDNERLKNQISDQNSSLNKLLDMMHSEKNNFQLILNQKDQIINQLKKTISDINEQQFNMGPLSVSHNKELDELKNRIMARKSTQRSSRERIQQTEDQLQSKVVCNEILNGMDTSARIDLQSIRNELQEDKENYQKFSNRNNLLKNLKNLKIGAD